MKGDSISTMSSVQRLLSLSDEELEEVFMFVRRIMLLVDTYLS